MIVVFFFFFQAEDGIRDLTVTGVQTCALPISPLQASAATPAQATQPAADREREPAATPAPTAPVAAAANDASAGTVDRKSTRLNSSHSQISYAVFCLKKKKQYPGTAPQVTPPW